MKPLDVSTEIAIGLPREQVAQYAANPEHAPDWYVNIKSVEWQTEPPLTVGSRVAFVAHFLGRRLAYTYEFTEWVPNERLVMRTAEGPFPMETIYTWTQAAEGHTHMRLQNRGQPAGFSAIFAPFMAMAMRRAMTKDLQQLKRILEGR